MGEAWPPDTPSKSECARCGAHVSHQYHRQWSDNDGVVYGCPECVPRSIRFGEDVYDRDLEDVEFERDDPNRKKRHGGVKNRDGTTRPSK